MMVPLGVPTGKASLTVAVRSGTSGQATLTEVQDAPSVLPDGHVTGPSTVTWPNAGTPASPMRSRAIMLKHGTPNREAGCIGTSSPNNKPRRGFLAFPLEKNHLRGEDSILVLQLQGILL